MELNLYPFYHLTSTMPLNLSSPYSTVPPYPCTPPMYNCIPLFIVMSMECDPLLCIDRLSSLSRLVGLVFSF